MGLLRDIKLFFNRSAPKAERWIKKAIGAIRKQLDIYGELARQLGYGELVDVIAVFVERADGFAHQSGPNKKGWVLGELDKWRKEHLEEIVPATSFVNNIIEQLVQLRKLEKEGK